MERAALTALPEHLLLDIVQYLDTAGDLSHLGASCRRARDLLSGDGWKTFVRTRFPSLLGPPAADADWRRLAQRLTYLDRCWEKRALDFTLWEEKAAKERPRSARSRQSLGFQAILAAQTLSASQDEVLAFGAGENLFLRRRPADGHRPGNWTTFPGSDYAFSAGTGDVTALSAIECDARPELIVGRADGQLQRISVAADGSKGQARLLLPAHVPAARRWRSPAHQAVSWTEWQPQRRLVASCRSAVVSLYDLSPDASPDHEADLRPAASCDLSGPHDWNDASLVRSAKFLGDDAMAFGIGGTSQPLRWAKIRPTGLELVGALEDDQPSAGQTILAAPTPHKTVVRALEVVGGRRNSGNLLLSAWEDGSYRLLDIRTPSNRDSIYRDSFQPYDGGSSLLVFGNERFVAGGHSEPLLRFFDFRHPKPYYHSDALPCSGQLPFPMAPGIVRIQKNGRKSAPPPWDRQASRHRWCCDHEKGLSCTWHETSRLPSWRPDATVYFGNRKHEGICSLAKTSNISGSFYCGLRGAVAEASLRLAEDTNRSGIGRTPPPEWISRQPGSGVSQMSLMETGVGSCDSNEWLVSDAITSVVLYKYRSLPVSESNTSLHHRHQRSRLDSRLER